jgi:hypothetical protein
VARGEPLRVLHDLNRIDKHCVLHLTGHTLEGTMLATEALGGSVEGSEAFNGPFEDGAVLARVVVTPPNAEVNMQFGASFNVVGNGC